MKRVLIIGSTSMVGRALADALTAGADVAFAGRRNADLLLNLGQDFDWSTLNASYDTVVNVAAHFGTQQPHEMIEAVRVNSLGALQSCILAKHVSARHVVHISSLSASYDQSHSLYSAYSLTKRQGEELCELFCRSHALQLAILRPTQLYDETGSARAHQGMLYHILDLAAEGKDITIFGRRDPLRNYVFLPDFAEVCKRVIERGVTGRFDVAHAEVHRLSEIATLAYATFGTDGTVGFDRLKPDLEDIEVSMDTRLAEAIGYTPATSLADGIELYRRYSEQRS